MQQQQQQQLSDCESVENTVWGATQVQECAAEVQHILQVSETADPVQRDLLSARLSSVRTRLTPFAAASHSTVLLSSPETPMLEHQHHQQDVKPTLLPFNGLVGGHISALTFVSPAKVWRPF